MKPVRISFLLCFLFALVLNSCNNGLVKVVSTNANNGYLDVHQPIVFNFSDNIAPTNKIDEWTNDKLIEFTPELNGKFKWEDGKTLIFSPETDLMPSTDYVGKMTSKIEKSTTKKISKEDLKLSTTPFSYVKSECYWDNVEGGSYEVNGKIKIEFTEPVNPEELQKSLKLTCNSKDVVYNLLTKTSSNIIEISTNKLIKNKETQKIEVTINKGLQSIFKRKPLAESSIIKFDLQPIENLDIKQVYAGLDVIMGWIEIQSNQAIDKEKAKQFIKLTPDVPFELTQEDNHLKIEGEFKPGTEVKVILKQGLKGLYGGSLSSDLEYSVVINNARSMIAFTDASGRYLLWSGQKTIGIQTVNTEEVNVSIHKISEENIIHFLSENIRGGDYYYGENAPEESSTDLSYVNLENYATQIWAENFTNTGRTNTLFDYQLDMSKIKNYGKKGLYLVKIANTEDYYDGKSKIVYVTNLGIISRVSDKNISVFVNDIATTEPVSNAKVKIYSNKHELMYEGTTNQDGAYQVNIEEQINKEIKVKYILVKKEEDCNFLDLNSCEIPTSKFDISGKELASSGYDAFIYSSRDLFRAGETIPLSAIIRNRDRLPVENQPFILELVANDEKVISRWKKTTNTQGSFELKYEVPKDFMPGKYKFNLKSGDQTNLNSYQVTIRDFAPDQLKMNLKPYKKILYQGDKMSINGKIDFIFGAPAAKQAFDININFQNTDFGSSKYSDYQFSSPKLSEKRKGNIYYQGISDQEGNFSYTSNTLDSINTTGYINANATITFIDLSGHQFIRSQNFKIYGKKHYLGIKYDGNNVYNLHSPARIDFIAVGPENNLCQKVPAEIELAKIEWVSNKKINSEGREFYESQKTTKIIYRKSVYIDGKSYINDPIHEPGDYELRLYEKGSADYVSKSFNVWEDYQNSQATYSVNKNGFITITPQKDVNEVGQNNKIVFSTPFNGKMLVTIEKESVLSYQYIEVKNKKAEINLKLTDNHLPNIYVTATLFKKHEFDENNNLVVAHGFQKIMVKNSNYELKPKIIAPDQIKPNKTQRIIVQSGIGKKVFGTIALVDEGILQITDYKTPDISNYYNQALALDVKSYDIYRFLFPELGKMSTGADMMAMMKKLSVPILANRYKLISYWSGILESDNSGNFAIDVPIGQYAGKLRVMTCLYSDKYLGSADKSITVMPDVILSPNIPKFLSPNDEIEIPVALINTTNKSGNVQVKIGTTGGIIVMDNKLFNVNLGANESKTVSFKIKSPNQTGIAKINIGTSGMYQQMDETEIAIRPLSPNVYEGTSGSLTKEELSIICPSGFISSNSTSRLNLSKFPALKFSKQINYLLGYPYGCLEQTVSKAFPQLFAKDLLLITGKKDVGTAYVDLQIQNTINNISSQFQYGSLIPTWKGVHDYNAFTNVYAVHFLAEAKKAGYNVDKSTLSQFDNSLKQIANQGLNQLGTKSSDFYLEDFYKNEKIKVSPLTGIYALYVSSLIGKIDLSTLNSYTQYVSRFGKDEIFLLSLTYGQANQWSIYHSFMNSINKENNLKKSDYSLESFDSEVRNNALLLNAFLETDPNNIQVNYLSNYLAKQVDGNNLYTTQETSWILIALGKLAKIQNQNPSIVDVYINGIKKYNFTGNSLSVPLKQGDKVTLKTISKGLCYYAISTEGVKNTIPAPITSGLVVTKQYTDMSGKNISNSVKVGELINVKLTVSSKSTFEVDNIAISDLLPAGFEPIVDYKNGLISNSIIQDDRIISIISLPANSTKTITYQVRATNLGNYFIAPISAEAMYNPELRFVGLPTRLNIVKRDLIN